MSEEHHQPAGKPLPKWRAALARGKAWFANPATPPPGTRRWRPWALAGAAFAVALVAALTIWGKLRRDVWAYYTDGEEIRAELDDERLRPVLWQDPQPQHFEGGPAASPPADQVEAAFSADGTAMVLVRREGAGKGADLYLSRWDGRLWSKPEPLPSINTEADELGPALSHDGRYLYFASDRAGGQGGYDLYVARWDGRGWVGVEPLPTTVNTSADELGPALSPDDRQLFFSSTRDGASTEDIFVSKVTPPAAAEPRGGGEAGPAAGPRKPSEIARVQPAKPFEPAKVPEFAYAEPVDDLNSKAADVQAAMSKRGDHVFLASDRDRGKGAGFKVYFSRVVDGELLPPEQVDLYFDSGDVTDPAVRMDGFDLLFSSNHEAGDGAEADAERPGYVLYRSTTREVVGYTDLSRWEQFKELMGNIAWWLLLALAALIALIYILEKWQDITSLFHKCLAASGIAHLLGLLLAMAWLIAREIEDDEDGKYEEIAVNIDALAEEELALESIPEETALTETTTNLETEKVESEFGAPGFEPKDEAQPVADAQTAKEALLVEAEPALSEPVEPPAIEPAQPPEVMQELAATTLPEIEQPQLEERDPAEPQPVADTSEDIFDPLEPATESVKAEAPTPAESAVQDVAAASQVTEARPPEPLVDSATESVVEAVAEAAQPDERPPTEEDPLDSAMLAALPPSELVDPSTPLEETDPSKPQEATAPTDPSQDLFDPGQAVAAAPTSQQAEGENVADSALTSATDASAVPSSNPSAASGTVESQPGAVGEASAAADVPSPSFELVSIEGLPPTELLEPEAPALEEPGGQPAGAPADTSQDIFEPLPSTADLATAPAPSETVADSTADTAAEAGEVVSAEMVAGALTIEAHPPALASAIPADALPPTPLDPAPVGALPEAELVDPGAPKLEEGGKPPAGAPADTSGDQFKPAGAIAGVTSAQADHQATPDATPAGQSDAASVAGGSRVAESSAVEARPPEVGEAAAPGAVPPTPEIGAGLPESRPVDPAAPKLEEPDGGAQPPADRGKEQFTPGGSVPNLATSQAGGHAVADSAVRDAAAASSVAGASQRPSASTAAARNPLESSGTMPDLETGALAGALPNPAALPSPGLPGKLDAPDGLDPGSVAREIQKQRGKPGLETIKRMGGSEGTEGAIGAAIQWLVENQEEDGRWDTEKHGANNDYDTGGTGLALLCFYGWGERHDKECKYRESVRAALDWLLAQQRGDGYLGGRPGMMYSHAIAAIALCEAYGITKDPKLRGPAERAIAYTLKAQSKSRGGWRYRPGEDSDTSVTGWQYMALHSARMAGLEVPEDAFRRARGFLDKMGGGKHGGLYGYQERGKLSRAMVATGMFCRQLDLVPPTHPMQQESARLLKLHPMKVSGPDLYYVYYATLALYQHQGPTWADWNEKLKATLPLIQKKSGGEAGSWDPSASMTKDGGRVVSTALATLSLEVYYRLLPMYGFRDANTPAPEVERRE